MHMIFLNLMFIHLNGLKKFRPLTRVNFKSKAQQPCAHSKGWHTYLWVICSVIETRGEN
jgi:hypothetical protein